MALFYTTFNAPFSEFQIFADKDSIISLNLHKIDKIEIPGEQLNIIHQDNDVLMNCKQELTEYFSGQRKVFTIPLNPQGTEFQKTVWQTLLKIPFGKTWHYQKLALAVNKPGASRAVGNANGKNPIPIIIPCHRIINKNGKIGGYSGGLEIKRWLLNHEGSSANTFPGLF